MGEEGYDVGDMEGSKTIKIRKMELHIHQVKKEKNTEGKQGYSAFERERQVWQVCYEVEEQT